MWTLLSVLALSFYFLWSKVQLLDKCLCCSTEKGSRGIGYTAPLKVLHLNKTEVLAAGEIFCYYMNGDIYNFTHSWRVHEYWLLVLHKACVCTFDNNKHKSNSLQDYIGNETDHFFIHIKSIVWIIIIWTQKCNIFQSFFLDKLNHNHQILTEKKKKVLTALTSSLPSTGVHLVGERGIKPTKQTNITKNKAKQYPQ